MFQGNLRELPPFGETLGMDWIETDSSDVCLRLGVSDQVKLTAESEISPTARVSLQAAAPLLVRFG